MNERLCKSLITISMLAKMLGISKHITTNLFGSSNTIIICLHEDHDHLINNSKKMMLEQQSYLLLAKYKLKEFAQSLILNNSPW